MMEFEGIKKKEVETKPVVNNEVKSYKLSDEELAEVRKKTGWNRDEFNKEIYVQRKQEGKTDREIMKEFNLYPKKLNELKHEWKLIGVKEAEFLKMKEETENKEQEVTKAEQQEEAVKPVPNEVSELQLRIKELEECEVQLSERNAYLETELTNLSDELERYKSTLTKERTEASDEYGRILKKNSELAVMVKDLKEENERMKVDLDDLKGMYNVSLEQRRSLESQLKKLEMEPCQYCETLKEESSQLWNDKNKLASQISELEKEIWCLKNELNEADENIDANDKYKRLWESAAFALKEMIEVELFGVGGESDA